MPNIYLGSAIDNEQNPFANFSALSELALKVYPEAVLYSPLEAFKNAQHAKTRDAYRFVIEINMMALERADLALFLWTNTPSFGMPQEIAYCAQQEKPFAVLWKADRSPGIYLKHCLHPRSMWTPEAETLVEWLSSEIGDIG